MSDPIETMMSEVINRWRDVAAKVPQHAKRRVGENSVAWWFDPLNASTADFLEALSKDPLLVTPGASQTSNLVTSLLVTSRPMGNTLSADTTIISQWIDAGCPLPLVRTNPSIDAGQRAKPNLPSPAEEKEAFFKLANLESNPEFRPTAKMYAKAYLANAEYSADPMYGEFEYSEHAFSQRLMDIYNSFVEGDMYVQHDYDNPIVEYDGARYLVGRASDRVVVDNLIQKAPFNLLDGVWLQNIMSARPSDSVMSKLFDIWADEAGNGDVEQNHANVYDNLLKSRGVYLPRVSSRDFIEYPFVDGAWRTAVFQASVGAFPQEFFPELLGMTLYLEWEATPTLTPIVKMLRGRRIDPLFYQLHVAIDNISEGHGALAKEAIITFLDQQRAEGGEIEVQKAWKRVWNGYVTWATAGFLGYDMQARRLLIDKKQIKVGGSAGPVCFPNLKDYFRDSMVSLVQRKAPFARQVHGGVVIGGKALNKLFDNPVELLDTLEANGFIDPKHPRDSRLIQLMKFEGPMYRVFSEQEQEVVLDWIESLGDRPYQCIDPLPSDDLQGAPEKMAQLIASHADMASFAHDDIVLSTGDGEQKPLKELFASPAILMGALVASGWVVPNQPGRSVFVTRVLTNGGPMNGVLSANEVDVVVEWISTGAQQPKAIATTLFAAGFAGNLVMLSDGRDHAKATFARQRKLIGMGVVH